VYVVCDWSLGYESRFGWQSVESDIGVDEEGCAVKVKETKF
jgi:hypothetical protein